MKTATMIAFLDNLASAISNAADLANRSGKTITVQKSGISDGEQTDFRIEIKDAPEGLGPMTGEGSYGGEIFHFSITRKIPIFEARYKVKMTNSNGGVLGRATLKMAGKRRIPQMSPSPWMKMAGSMNARKFTLRQSVEFSSIFLIERTSGKVGADEFDFARRYGDPREIPLQFYRNS